MARKFRELSAPIVADPENRSRIDIYKRAMRDVLALAKVRESRGMTQAQLAAQLDVTQANVSRIERQDDLYLSTLKQYIEALGGRLEIHAVFDDQTIELHSS
jgi:DNA-binding XRE family transcriptional regulator